ncbi:MAG: hypothetical protein AB8B93_19765 [Pseudomonadales bacterium]
MSLEQRQIDQVLTTIQNLVAAGTTSFRPGHVADALRDNDEPLGTWQIRSILSRLEQDGLIEIDPQTSAWSLCKDAKASAG